MSGESNTLRSCPHRFFASMMRLVTSCCCEPSAAKMLPRYLKRKTFFNALPSHFTLGREAWLFLCFWTRAAAAALLCLKFYVFHNKHGLKIHMAKCKRRDIHIVDKIVAVEGEAGSSTRRFTVRWQGYGAEDDTQEPYSNLPPHMIKEYLIANDIYNFNWPGARCPLCDKPCKNARGVKSHMQYCYHNNTGGVQDPQNFKQSI